MTAKKPAHISISAIIFLLFFSFNSFAQSSKYEVSGKVVDEAGRPLAYATISIQSTTNPDFLTGGITVDDGTFAIEVPEGTYDIKVEYISFESKTFEDRKVDSDVEMGQITLGMSAASLDEVVVTAETTQVEIRLDKKIYTIGKDLTTAGGTVSDALNNVPSVTVDIEGGISLRGNENVRILINGKPSAMAGFGDTSVLSQLPADAIERVEVITSPSARYGADGTAGILNIILKQKEILGFNGSLTLNAGTPTSTGVSANVNYRTENYNLFTTTGFRYGESPGNSYSNTEYFPYTNLDGELVDPELIDPVFDRVIEDRETDRINRGFYTNLGMEYFLNDHSSITGIGFFRTGDDEDFTENISERYQANNLVQETRRTELETEDDHSYQFALNYINTFDDKGQKLTADFQYENQSEVQQTYVDETLELNEFDEVPDFLREEVYTEEDQQEFLIQADYVLPLGEDSQFEAGIRGNFEEEVTDYQLSIENPNSGNLEIDDVLSNVFTYDENVSAIYTQYGTKLGDFSFLLGLRLENTQLKGDINSELSEAELQEEFGIPIEMNFDNNYLGLFPTVNLIYELAESENITLGYNRRINRPRGWFINPFPSRSSRTDIFQGNPNLEPAFSNAFDLGYLKRWKEVTFSSSVYYQHETDSFERVEQSTGKETSEGIPITRTIPINLATNDRIGAEAGLLYNPADWLRLNGSFNFFQFDTKGDYNGVDYSVKNTSWFARFSSKVTLPAEIQWQTTAFYRGASAEAQSTREPMASVNMALSKEIFNENATITLNVQDILNSRKYEAFTETPAFRRNSEMQWRRGGVSLSFIYRFNQQKNQQNKRMNGNENEMEDEQGAEIMD